MKRLIALSTASASLIIGGVPALAETNYVYLDCYGDREHKYFYPQTGETKYKSYKDEIHVTLDERNARVRIGHRERSGNWQKATFSGDSVTTTVKQSTFTDFAFFNRNTGGYSSVVTLKTDRLHSQITVLGKCIKKNPSYF